MARFIDDEAEWSAFLIFRGRHEKPPLGDGTDALAAKVGHNFPMPGCCLDVIAEATIQSPACRCSKSRRSLPLDSPDWSGRPWITSHSSGHLSRIVRSASFRS